MAVLINPVHLSHGAVRRLVIAVMCGLLFVGAAGCTKSTLNPRQFEIFSARNFSPRTIRVLRTTGFAPDMVSLGGVLIAVAPEGESFTATENLPKVHVADTITIVWVDGDSREGTSENQQDVVIPAEIFANHKERGDVLGFTFGPDKRWSVKLIPLAERGY